MWKKLHPSIHFNVVVFFTLFFTTSSKVSPSIQSSCFDLNLLPNPVFFTHHRTSLNNITMTVCTCSKHPAQRDSPSLDSKNQHLTLDNNEPASWHCKTTSPSSNKKSLSVAFKGSTCGLGVDLFKLFAISAFGNHVAYCVCPFQTRGKGQISFSWT